MMKKHTFELLGKKYTISEMPWSEDLDLQQKCTKEDGTVNFKELMVLRISKSLVEPKILSDEIRNLPLRESTILETLWIKVNGVDPSIFLGLTPTISDT